MYGGILFLQRLHMGLAKNLYNVWDTLWYIWKNGWVEYREARRRYDTHSRLQGYSEGRFNKKKYIKQLNLLKKRK
jgi:hypothetical protein